MHHLNTLYAEPSLTPAENAVVRSYGGWTEFMQTFGLKPWETEDIEDAISIIKSLVAADEEDAEGEETDQQLK